MISRFLRQISELFNTMLHRKIQLHQRIVFWHLLRSKIKSPWTSKSRYTLLSQVRPIKTMIGAIRDRKLKWMEKYPNFIPISPSSVKSTSKYSNMRPVKFNRRTNETCLDQRQGLICTLQGPVSITKGKRVKISDHL